MIPIIGIWSLFCIYACSHTERHSLIDRLNEQAYEYHYRNLDSAKVYAQRALNLSDGYDNGRAEALNNLAFVCMAHMDYDQGYRLLIYMDHVTDNQVELLVADVQMMRLCQRKSDNKEFYVYRERAMRRMHRIDEERSLLTPHQQRRMTYACSEFYIVASVYFYYVGLTEQSRSTLMQLSGSDYLEQDTTQLLNYLYNVGSGGIVRAASEEEICQIEFESLLRCYQLARQERIPFFEAQALQGMSEHLIDRGTRERLVADNQPAIKYINTDDMADSLLAGNLAQRALNIFCQYGDVYQTAGSYRTLAECYWALRDYRSSLACLQRALTTDSVIQRAPDLVASIREQLSLAYSAIDDKPNSDYNRNIYLDMQEKTRQDRQLEARADQLGKSSELLNIMIAIIVFMILFIVVMLIVLYIKRQHSDDSATMDTLLQPLHRWKTKSEQRMAQQEEEREEVDEQVQIAQLHLQSNRRRNLEQRAKLSLVTSITPLIDRILHEVSMLKTASTEDTKTQAERIAYIGELTDKINEYNAVLTDWIRLRQGELNLKVESFALQALFDIVARSRMGFQLKGITLDVKPTDTVVKADKTLTLFMINTLADNARKFTPAGGSVTISAQHTDHYVEISVCDTGVGMDQDTLSRLFDHKPIIDATSAEQDGKSHGFGLMNCKGIIDKYRKVSPVFAPCAIGAESEGRGSRFWFRLPLGVVRTALLLLLLISGIRTSAESHLEASRRYADSTYYNNIEGRYLRTIAMADSCISHLNAHYQELTRTNTHLMRIYGKQENGAAELYWLRHGVRTDYTVILNMRNEVAVAALALHRWNLYNYNNRVYTKLFRERSADSSLGHYVRIMQRSETNKNVAIIILVVLLLLLFPSYYIFYYRYRLRYRFSLDRIRQINDCLLSDRLPQEQLTQIQALWHTHGMALDRDFQPLQELVRQICTALQQQIDFDREQADSLEIEKDELARRRYEADRLHISNSVLDNCLSTLKHETMYYPSRIRQLVDSQPLDIMALEEITGYYKSLYAILSEQALRQTDKAMHIDQTMWQMLIDVLRNRNGAPVTWTIERRDTHYINVSIPMPRLALTSDQCHTLFTPSTIDVAFLLCRQIIRELGEETHARACGIEAHTASTGIVIRMIVPADTPFFQHPIKEKQD